MKKKEFTAVVARLCYYSSGEADLNSWMQQNESQVKSFYKWLEEYQWK